jgi:transcriptional regulator with XRE-family HTH domain
MTCQLTDDLREATKAAFDKYKHQGVQAAAAKEMGVSRQYVWAVLNGEREDDKRLIQLADFIDAHIKSQIELTEQKKEKTSMLRTALAL